ncbi:MAG: ketopantoate reductase family protein [Acidimicrobiales bacterium]
MTPRATEGAGGRTSFGAPGGSFGSTDAIKVAVVGAGAIGSLFAAHLSQVAEVHILTRRKSHAEAINSGGLQISGKSRFLSRPHATAEAGELPACDLVVLSTKATDLERAMVALEGHEPSAVMMTAQNGLGAEEIVHRHGPWRLISGVTFMSGIRQGDDHVQYELDAPTWIGPGELCPASFEVVSEVARLVDASGLKIEAMEDVRPAKWSKLIFNATVNGVAALTELPHDSHFRAEAELFDLGHLVHELMAEGKQVAASAGIELFEDPWEMNLQAVHRGETSGGSYRHLPSMLEDVLAKRTTEVDFINGQLVRAGLAAGVDVTRHLVLYRLIRAKEASYAMSTGAS